MPIPIKTEVVGCRVTPDHAALIRACAEMEGVRVSEWLRKVAIRRATKRLGREAAASGRTG